MLSLLFAPPAFCASSLSECAAVDAALAAGQPGLPLLVQSSQARRSMATWPRRSGGRLATAC